MKERCCWTIIISCTVRINNKHGIHIALNHLLDHGHQSVITGGGPGNVSGHVSHLGGPTPGRRCCEDVAAGAGCWVDWLYMTAPSPLKKCGYWPEGEI